MKIKVQPKLSQETIKKLEDFVIPEGLRNISLAKLAWNLRVNGMESTRLPYVLTKMNEICCKPPLPQDEIDSIARSMTKYPATEYDSAAYSYISASEKKHLTAKELIQQIRDVIGWLWVGFLGLGMVTLFSSKPKVGKTTFLFHALRAIFKGTEFLNKKIKLTGKVLLLTEEPLNLIKRRIEKHSLNEDRFLIASRFSMKSWQETIAYIDFLAETENVELAIVDTIASFWNVETENDATDVINALKPIQEVAQKRNIAILLIHHLRKADGEENVGHRGSGALVGAVENILEIRRHPSGKNRRILVGTGRYEESVHEIALELDEETDSYRCLGSKEDLEFDQSKKKIFEAVPGADESPQNWKTILKKVSEPKPSATVAKQALSNLTDTGSVLRFGNGVKNDPYLFRKRESAASVKLKVKVRRKLSMTNCKNSKNVAIQKEVAHSKSQRVNS